MRPDAEQLLIDALGEAHWDEATELTSMIADDHYPDVLDSGVRGDFAARLVIALVTDEDYRRCLYHLRQPPSPEEERA